MARMNLSIHVDAAPEPVFDVVSDIEKSSSRAGGIDGR